MVPAPIGDLSGVDDSKARRSQQSNQPSVEDIKAPSQPFCIAGRRPGAPTETVRTSCTGIADDRRASAGQPRNATGCIPLVPSNPSEPQFRRGQRHPCRYEFSFRDGT